MHITNHYSETSTDKNHMCFYFNHLGNMTLNSYYSRFFEWGFALGYKSNSGISVCKKGSSELSGKIDSRKMVQNIF